MCSRYGGGLACPSGEKSRSQSHLKNRNKIKKIKKKKEKGVKGRIITKVKEMTCRFIVDKFHTRDCDGRTSERGAHGFADGPLFERIGFVSLFHSSDTACLLL